MGVTVMENFLIQLLNGLVSGMLLFVMAAGLSLIFGLMDVINLSHGALYLLGGYIGLTMVRQLDNYWLALLAAPLLVGSLGMIIQYLFLRRLHGRQRHLDQVLFTFGVALITIDLSRATWGAYVESVSPPALLTGLVPVLTFEFPVYRLALLGFGLALALALWLFIERTRLGAIVRAGVSDAEMVGGLGINIQLVFAGVFALGTALAGLAGVVGAPVLNLYPGLDSEILILALVVVVVGGLGTLKGAFFGSLLIGLADTFGKALLPEFARFLIFAVMAAVLLIRPSGLFGQKGS
ncbi:MAG TPA: branched-chain amino acid ABC transporter permease [Anaerolineae bacterium]|nr:branched-chain amino acid ABC transporter permease [Anaerolineae bacterium]